MTVLIAGGDSFTFGSELPSQEHAWSGLLAKKLGMNYCCTAMPGASNSSIRRRVMNAVANYENEEQFVAVMWSFPNRYEFRFAYDTGHRDSPWYSINPWTYNDDNVEEHFINSNDNILKQQQENRANAELLGITDFAKSYVQNVAQTEYWELYTSWSEIVMLQNYLIKHNINYIFAHVDDILFEYNSTMDASLRTLREDIDKSKWILDEGMYNWAKRTKQDFYTTHPTEKAHAIWVNNHLLHSQMLHKYIK
jgi:hypothetical protein